MSGTVNVSRDLFGHEFFAPEPFTEREAWIWMIMEASWKPRMKRAGDYVVELHRGQLVASVRFMAAAWKWNAPKVQRFIARLKKLEMVIANTDTGVTVITICNYDKFQNGAKSADTVAIQERYTSDTNEKKGERREKESSSAEPAGFAEFWEVYPHRGGAKRGRKLALDKFAAALKRGATERQIIDGARRYRSDRGVIDGYAKDPATWLNQECWNDEVEQPQKRPNASPTVGETRVIGGVVKEYGGPIGGWLVVH